MSTSSQVPNKDHVNVPGPNLIPENRKSQRGRPVPPVPQRPAAIIKVAKHGQDTKEVPRPLSATGQPKVCPARPIPPIPSKKPSRPVPICPPRPKVDGEISTNPRSVADPGSNPPVSGFDSGHSVSLKPDCPTPVTRKLSKPGHPPQRPAFPPVLKHTSPQPPTSSPSSSLGKTPPARPPSLVTSSRRHENTLQLNISEEPPAKPPPRPQPRTSLNLGSTEKLSTCVTPPKPQPRKRVSHSISNSPSPSNSCHNLNDNNNNTSISNNNNNNNNLNDINNNISCTPEQLPCVDNSTLNPTVSSSSSSHDAFEANQFSEDPIVSVSVASHQTSESLEDKNHHHHHHHSTTPPPILPEPSADSFISPDVDPSDFDPSNVDPSNVDTSNFDPSTVDPSSVELTSVDPSIVDPSNLDPSSDVEPATVDPSSDVQPDIVEPSTDAVSTPDPCINSTQTSSEAPHMLSHSLQNQGLPVPSPRIKKKLDIKSSENSNDSLQTSPSEELRDFQSPSLEDDVSPAESRVKRPTIIRPPPAPAPATAPARAPLPAPKPGSGEEPTESSSGKRNSLPRPPRPPIPITKNFQKNSSFGKSSHRPPPPIPKREPVSSNLSDSSSSLHGSTASIQQQSGMKKPSNLSESAENQGEKRSESPTKEPDTKGDAGASRFKNFLFARKGSSTSPPANVEKKPAAVRNRKAAEMLQTTKDYTKRISRTLGFTAEKPSAVWYTEEPPESKPPVKPPPKPKTAPTTWYVEHEEEPQPPEAAPRPPQKNKKVPERPPCSPLDGANIDLQQQQQTSNVTEDGGSTQHLSVDTRGSNAFEKFHSSFKKSIENISKTNEDSVVSLLDLDVHKGQVDEDKMLQPVSDFKNKRPPDPPKPKPQVSASNVPEQPLPKPPPKPKVPPHKKQVISNIPPPVPPKSQPKANNIRNKTLEETKDSNETTEVSKTENVPNVLISRPKNPTASEENTSNICDNMKTEEIQSNQSESVDVRNISDENLVGSDENENVTTPSIQNEETFTKMANNNLSSSDSNLMQKTTIELVDENANENITSSRISSDLSAAEQENGNSTTKQPLLSSHMSNSLNARCVNLINDLKNTFEKSPAENSSVELVKSSTTEITESSTMQNSSSDVIPLEKVKESPKIEENSSSAVTGLRERVVESLFDVEHPDQSKESSPDMGFNENHQSDKEEIPSEVVPSVDQLENEEYVYDIPPSKSSTSSDLENKTKLKSKPQRPPSLPQSVCSPLKSSVKEDVPETLGSSVKEDSPEAAESVTADEISAVEGTENCRIIESPDSKTTEPCGIAEYNFEAQEDDELSMKKGDHVTLLSWVDNSWLYGTCNGLSGIFPKDFITIIHPLPNPTPPPPPPSSAPVTDDTSNTSHEVEPTDPSYVPPQPNNPAVLAFDNDVYQSLSEVTTGCGSVAPTKLNTHSVDPSTLKSPEQSDLDNLLSPIDEASHVHNEDDDTTDSELLDRVSFPVGGEETIAITLYDFDGEEGELSFKAQQEVTVLKWVNNDWLWGRIGDQTGNLPANFVDFIADRNYEEHFKPVVDDDDVINTEPELHPPPLTLHTDETTDRLLTCVAKQLEMVQAVKDYARARYDFIANSSEELGFRKGDRIEVLEIHSDWAKGRLNKKVGTFPTAFVSFEEDLHSDEVDSSPPPKYDVVKALYDFKGVAEDELSFEAGDMIFCLGEVKSCPGWSQGTLNCQAGIFPTNFVSSPITDS
ncbi:putative mediator of RNA polymerase II transcription subunit 26 isoform X1 [Argonauta hians]